MSALSEKYIYFIKPTGMSGPIKIGCSDMPSNRLESIMTWSPLVLELIGSVRGTSEDERFLHQCFANLHSHGEWFQVSPALTEAIDLALASGSISALRAKLKPFRDIRRPGRAKRSHAYKRCFSYRMRIFWAERHLQGITEAWAAPADVDNIMKRWVLNTRVGGDMVPPTNTEINRLEEYLAEPAAHSRMPVWARAAA